MEMRTIIKRVKELGPTALIAKESFRNFVEKFESEINRGISTLCILSIIIIDVFLVIALVYLLMDNKDRRKNLKNHIPKDISFKCKKSPILCRFSL